MKILVASPHPDDESIGCGGALAAHVADGDEVAVVFLTSGEEGMAGYPVDYARRWREREARKATGFLGVNALSFLRLPDAGLGGEVAAAARGLAGVLRAERPDVVYVPHDGDDHLDHMATLAALRLALADSGPPKPRLLGFEVWTPLNHFDEIVDISDHMATKMLAVRSYRSQVRYCRYDLAIKGLNAYRGALAAGSAYAEVFAELSW
jgi:LmbE family N-acetylglucosaminyl deacetylase